MKKLMGLFLLLLNVEIFAFDQITEVLVSGKVLICKKLNQELNGNIVENFKSKHSSNRFDSSRVKKDEFILPKVGEKIKITRSNQVKKNRFDSSYVNTAVGEAVIVEKILDNESRIQITYPGGGIHIENQVAFTEAEKDRVNKECLLAAPIDSAKFKNYDFVNF